VTLTSFIQKTYETDQFVAASGKLFSWNVVFVQYRCIRTSKVFRKSLDLYGLVSIHHFEIL